MSITRFRGEYRFLSNFWPAPVPGSRLSRWGLAVDDGAGGCLEFPTVEHAFQACKVRKDGDGWRPAVEAIRTAPEPGDAKALGREVPLREDWERIKVTVMLACLRAKFAPGSELARRLLDTGYQTLVEGNTWNDRYWGAVYQPTELMGGVGGLADWKGRNMLGRCLMLVRAELDVYATTGAEWRS